MDLNGCYSMIKHLILVSADSKKSGPSEGLRYNFASSKCKDGPVVTSTAGHNAIIV